MRKRLQMILFFLSICAVAGCPAPPKWSILTPEDYQYISSQMAEKMCRSPFLGERTMDSPKLVITITKVENLTSDIIPVAAQWYMVARVVDSLPMTEIRKSKNLTFTIPADRLREARQKGELGEGFAVQREPTHVMTAVFRSMTRMGGGARTDLYYCGYNIIDLKAAECVWADQVEFKKVAVGRTWD